MRQPIVAGPTFDARQYGLLSVVEPRYTETDPHWQLGVRYRQECGLGGSVTDLCITTESQPVSGATKVENRTTNWFAAPPITIYGRWDCTPVGYTEDQLLSMATDALARTEQFQIEQAVWTGQTFDQLAAVSNTQVPRLASTSTTFQGGVGPTVTTQTAATVIGPTGTPLDVVEAIQLLEGAYYDCYGDGYGTLHIPVRVGEMLFRSNAVKSDGVVLRTQIGTKVALGAGYRGSGPGATVPEAAPANSQWIYMTGPVFAYRSAVTVLGTLSQAFDRSSNTVERIAERTYVVGWMGCCHLAALVSTGGIVTGQPQSAF